MTMEDGSLWLVFNGEILGVQRQEQPAPREVRRLVPAGTRAGTGPPPGDEAR